MNEDYEIITADAVILWMGERGMADGMEIPVV